jgi:PAS domain S-box-containing protein
MSSDEARDEERIRRITAVLRRLRNDELPDRLPIEADDALGELEREANHTIEAHDARFQERLLFSVGPVVLFRWRNSDGWPVEYVSDNVIDLTGHSGDDFMSRKQIYSDLIAKEDLPRVFEEVQRFSAAGNPWFVHEPYRLVRPDGRTVWVSDYSVIRRDASGAITHYFGYLFDITERIEELKRLEKSESIIRQLKTPVLQVWDGILAMPVLGAVDEERAAQMTESLLSEVSGQSVRVAVLDLTGLEEVNGATMEHLVRMVRAVQLLGCKCVVSGISPAVARVIVELGIDTGALSTFATLQSALGYALKWSETKSKPAVGKR